MSIKKEDLVKISSNYSINELTSYQMSMIKVKVISY
jgi:hypothetical protein